jgi:hypothetical protein
MSPSALLILLFVFAGLLCELAAAFGYNPTRPALTPLGLFFGFLAALVALWP